MTLKEIGDLIRLALAARGWRQVDLASAAGLSPDVINAMVNGRRKAGLLAYEEVAKVLGLTFTLKIPIEEGR